MKIVRILGGLGNQMFQYAFYLSLLEKGFEAKIDITQFRNYKLHNGYELERIFNVDPQIATYDEVKKNSRNKKNELISKLNRKILPPKPTEFLEKKAFKFDSDVFRTKGNTYFEGYWQNHLYFKDIKNKVLEEFHFKKPLKQNNIELLRQIISSNSVSIHIRRGDYLTEKNLGAVCNIAYYSNALEFISLKVKNPTFFVFSDDIVWCKTHLPDRNYKFVDYNIGTNSYLDMQLMSNCKHNIIANSSFSWWAAWLNDNCQKIVISPVLWTKDISSKTILPNDWIKI